MAQVEPAPNVTLGETSVSTAPIILKRGGPIRKTVDYSSNLVRLLENRIWQRDTRDVPIIQPDISYFNEVAPPMGLKEHPVNAVTTKFVRAATNKSRCPIFCTSWVPDGRRVITGAVSGEFTLWNGVNFSFESILQGHDCPVRSMVWSHKGVWMVTTDDRGFVKYWQSNLNNVHTFKAHEDPVRCSSISPTDTKLATCSDDGTVRIWDFIRSTEEFILRGHGADVKTLDWHPRKDLLVSGSKDNQQPVKLWDPKAGQSVATIHAHKATVMSVKWNKNGNWLLTAARDNLIKIYDIRNMKEMYTLKGHKNDVNTLAWHPIHEKLFASGGSDGAVLFWLVGNEHEIGGMESAHESFIWSLSWHPLGHVLCSGSNDHTSKFWCRNRPGDEMKDKYNNSFISTMTMSEEMPESSGYSLPGMGASHLRGPTSIKLPPPPSSSHRSMDAISLPPPPSTAPTNNTGGADQQGMMRVAADIKNEDSTRVDVQVLGADIIAKQFGENKPLHHDQEASSNFNPRNPRPFPSLQNFNPRLFDDQAAPPPHPSFNHDPGMRGHPPPPNEMAGGHRPEHFRGPPPTDERQDWGGGGGPPSEREFAGGRPGGNFPPSGSGGGRPLPPGGDRNRPASSPFSWQRPDLRERRQSYEEDRRFEPPPNPYVYRRPEHDAPPPQPQHRGGGDDPRMGNDPRQATQERQQEWQGGRPPPPHDEHQQQQRGGMPGQQQQPPPHQQQGPPFRQASGEEFHSRNRPGPLLDTPPAERGDEFDQGGVGEGRGGFRGGREDDDGQFHHTQERPPPNQDHRENWPPHDRPPPQQFPPSRAHPTVAATQQQGRHDFPSPSHGQQQQQQQQQQGRHDFPSPSHGQQQQQPDGAGQPPPQSQGHGRDEQMPIVHDPRAQNLQQQRHQEQSGPGPPLPPSSQQRPVPQGEELFPAASHRGSPTLHRSEIPPRNQQRFDGELHQPPPSAGHLPPGVPRGGEESQPASQNKPPSEHFFQSQQGGPPHPSQIPPQSSAPHAPQTPHTPPIQRPPRFPPPGVHRPRLDSTPLDQSQPLPPRFPGPTANQRPAAPPLPSQVQDPRQDFQQQRRPQDFHQQQQQQGQFHPAHQPSPSEEFSSSGPPPPVQGPSSFPPPYDRDPGHQSRVTDPRIQRPPRPPVQQQIRPALPQGNYPPTSAPPGGQFNMPSPRGGGGGDPPPPNRPPGDRFPDRGPPPPRPPGDRMEPDDNWGPPHPSHPPSHPHMPPSGDQQGPPPGAYRPEREEHSLRVDARERGGHNMPPPIGGGGNQESSRDPRSQHHGMHAPPKDMMGAFHGDRGEERGNERGMMNRDPRDRPNQFRGSSDSTREEQPGETASSSSSSRDPRERRGRSGARGGRGDGGRDEKRERGDRDRSERDRERDRGERDRGGGGGGGERRDSGTRHRAKDGDIPSAKRSRSDEEGGKDSRTSRSKKK